MTPSAQDTLALRDIHLPADPGWWPPAWGWWVLAALCAALVGWLGMRLWRHLRWRRRRRHLLDLLRQLERSGDAVPAPEFLARLSRLLRQVALMRYPRREVASLSGRDWLRFLDATGGAGGFELGPGQVLAEGPYAATLKESPDNRRLVALVRTWIDSNSRGPNDA